ncbi:MAG TPA: hypothetical protein VHM88_14640 [Candidatus Acidoferrales bacterium]|nr:hypothetical protein [Candidatus Acidoferrales bacterium]
MATEEQVAVERKRIIENLRTVLLAFESGREAKNAFLFSCWLEDAEIFLQGSETATDQFLEERRARERRDKDALDARLS